MVAAITVPAMIQTTQDKEFHSRFKKVLSTLDNALRRAQVEAGRLGDNTVVFTPEDGADRHYNSAVRLSKYLNYTRVCKGQSDTGCDNLYAMPSFAVKFNADYMNGINMYPLVALTDGTTVRIMQNKSCVTISETCARDEEWNCITNEDGSIKMIDSSRYDCAELYIDVNGPKKPNKFGRDFFNIRINKDKIDIDSRGWAPGGGYIKSDILLNAK